jgi:transposase-like protein
VCKPFTVTADGVVAWDKTARRMRVATLFPNSESLLRLVTAVLIKISEDWETGRIYATMIEA